MRTHHSRDLTDTPTGDPGESLIPEPSRRRLLVFGGNGPNERDPRKWVRLVPFNLTARR
jgi:hypothetical protein